MTDVAAAIDALADCVIVAMIDAEDTGERPLAIDAGRLANRMCAASGIGDGDPTRPRAYELALARLPDVVEGIPDARYVTGMT